MRARGVGLVAWTLATAGCMHAARIFLDIPEGTGKPAPAPEYSEDLRALLEPPTPEPAPIEAVTNIDSVLALLPSLRSGGIDWQEAWSEGVIRPRAKDVPTESDSASDFSYDLYLSTGDGPEAYFPHSSHRAWLSCESCHPGIYRNGSDSYAQSSPHEQESCGRCHGSVAFRIQACEQCHERASGLPEDRQEKSFGAPFVLARLSVEGQGQGRFGQGFDLSGSYPPAVFPHGLHRLRYQCRACHESPFPMRRGATVMGQDDAHSSRGCGSCHDGGTAFGPELDSCERCHQRVGG